VRERERKRGGREREEEGGRHKYTHTHTHTHTHKRERPVHGPMLCVYNGPCVRVHGLILSLTHTWIITNTTKGSFYGRE
jgi:hypothetical protein